MFNTVFRDHNKSVFIIYIWSFILLFLFSFLGIKDSQFITIGPSDKTIFLNIIIDTWGKWILLSIFMFFNTLFKVFIDETVYPFICNTIQDSKCKVINYSRSSCMNICLTYYFYVNIISVLSIAGSFTQIDFLLIRASADLIISYYTTKEYLEEKIFEY